MQTFCLENILQVKRLESFLGRIFLNQQNPGHFIEVCARESIPNREKDY